MKESTFVVLVAVFYLVLFSWAAVDAIAPEAQQEMRAFGEWCTDRGGHVTNEKAMWHGGIHCVFENDTAVHIGEVNATQKEDSNESP